MKILGYYCLGHDANMCAYDPSNNRAMIVELERIARVRHYHLDTNNVDDFRSITQDCLRILERNGFENDYDVLCLPVRQYGNAPYPVDDLIGYRDVRYVHHQQAHAAVAFFQSPFVKALVICMHGGGDDGFFNVFVGHGAELREVYSSTLNLGRYSRVSRLIGALRSTRQPLSLPGKAMGLAGYGTAQADWRAAIKGIYLDREDAECVVEEALSDARSADLAATNQNVFETLLLDELAPVLREHPALPICLSGVSIRFQARPLFASNLDPSWMKELAYPRSA